MRKRNALREKLMQFYNLPVTLSEAELQLTLIGSVLINESLDEDDMTANSWCCKEICANTDEKESAQISFK